jgi:hypothetical protein
MMKDTVSIGDFKDDLTQGIKSGINFITAAANPLAAAVTAAGNGLMPNTPKPTGADVYNKLKTTQATAAAQMPVKQDPVLARALAAGNQVYQALRNAGVPDPAATFATFQAYHESQAFNDYKFLQYNNPSGIKYAGQSGAYPIPNNPNNYAAFNSLADWAKSMRYEITKKANPAGAATLEDYAARLKQNGYYEDSYDNYLSGLKRARLVLRTMPAAEWGYNPQMDYNPNTGASTPKKDLRGEWEQLPTWAKGALLVTTGVVLISAIKK